MQIGYTLNLNIIMCNFKHLVALCHKLILK